MERDPLMEMQSRLVASSGSTLTYHSQRARDELYLGLTARELRASRAHMQLASLHLQRVRELSGAGSGDVLEPM